MPVAKNKDTFLEPNYSTLSNHPPFALSLSKGGRR